MVEVELSLGFMSLDEGVVVESRGLDAVSSVGDGAGGCAIEPDVSVEPLTEPEVEPFTGPEMDPLVVEPVVEVPVVADPVAEVPGVGVVPRSPEVEPLTVPVVPVVEPVLVPWLPDDLSALPETSPELEVVPVASVLPGVFAL